MAFMFNAAEIDHFRTHGWVIAPDFWNQSELAAMRDSLDKLMNQGKLRNVATAGDGTTPTEVDTNLQLVPMAPHSEFFACMAHAEKARMAVAALIGAPFRLHLDQVFLKPPRVGTGTNWHQDNAYFHIRNPLRGVAMWTAVHDANTASGTLKVIPDVFTKKMKHTRDPMSDHHIRCFPDEAQSITLELKAGSVVFFCYGTPHTTTDNQSAYPRAGIAIHYLHHGEVESAVGGYPERDLVADETGGPAQPDRCRRFDELTTPVSNDQDSAV